MTTMPNPRIVIDTSVLISAVISPKGKPRQVVSHILAECVLLSSVATFDELATRLQQPKFRKYVRPDEVQQFVRLVRSRATDIVITEKITACRDPKDDKFLELAVCGRADCIVSSDQDLLVLHPFRGIPIFTPAAFLDALAA